MPLPESYPQKTIPGIACGEGYDSAMLHESRKQVIGVDASRMAIDHASTKYRNDNLKNTIWIVFRNSISGRQH